MVARLIQILIRLESLELMIVIDTGIIEEILDEIRWSLHLDEATIEARCKRIWGTGR